MLTDCRLPLLAVMLCLIDSGCISVRYRDERLPLEPTPATLPADCGDAIRAAPPLDAPSCLPHKPWHSRFHAALPGFWKVRREAEPPPVAPLIPPRSRFHPVPTRPVFARQVTFESVPRLIPSKVGTPLPEPIETPLPDEEADGSLDVEAGQPPRPLSDELRVASPISPGAPTEAR